MSAVFDALHRITAVGLICGGLLAVGGSGGQKEVLRLGCACLTVVVLLTALQRIPAPVLDRSRYEAQTRQQVAEAQEDALRATLRQTETDLAQYLEGVAADMGLCCEFSVVCAADGSNRVTVRQVEVMYQSGTREKLTELRDVICSQLAIGDQQLAIREATP